MRTSINTAHMAQALRLNFAIFNTARSIALMESVTWIVGLGKVAAQEA